MTETFGYDGLNRLVTSQVGTNAAKSYTYDAVGNLTGRSDWGSYTYPNYGPTSVRPHAVSSIAITQGAETGHTVAFAYDANGNLTGKTQTDVGSAVVSARSRSTVWNSFNMPNCIVAANGITSCSGNTAPNTQFWYGPEHQRIKQTSSQDGTTWYLNPDNAGGLAYEKDQKPDASIEQRHFLSAYGQVVAIVKCGADCTTRKLDFLYRDNLGSVTVITEISSTGTVVERLAYEPFGKRRLTNGNDDSTDSLTTANTTPNSGHTTSRGFTNHEMLDELGLVHMNGRIYDPQVGRFMSADFVIPSPYDMQAYNRYSYVFNRPLVMTDMDGQCPLCYVAIGLIIGGEVALAAGNEKLGLTLMGLGVAAVGPLGGTLASSMAAGFASGLVGSGGDLKAAMGGAATAGMMYGAGTLADDLAAKAGRGAWSRGGLGRAMLHAGAGCVGSAIGGGGCRSGAVSAGFSEAVGGRMSFNNEALDMMTHTVIGGMASELAGGTFENGAITGAFSYLFNQLAHRNRDVFSVRDGTVNSSDWENPNNHRQGFGYRLRIVATDRSVDIYAHMDPDSITVSVGDKVLGGQLLGRYSDQSTPNGGVTGAHLHFERRDVNGRHI